MFASLVGIAYVLLVGLVFAYLLVIVVVFDFDCLLVVAGEAFAD